MPDPQKQGTTAAKPSQVEPGLEEWVRGQTLFQPSLLMLHWMSHDSSHLPRVVQPWSIWWQIGERVCTIPFARSMKWISSSVNIAPKSVWVCVGPWAFYINNSSDPKSASQHYFGGSSSRNQLKEMLCWSERENPPAKSHSWNLVRTLGPWMTTQEGTVLGLLLTSGSPQAGLGLV